MTFDTSDFAEVRVTESTRICESCAEAFEIVSHGHRAKRCAPCREAHVYPSEDRRARRSRRRSEIGLSARSQALSQKSLRADAELLRVEYAPELAELDRLRPKTRAECRGAERPCPWFGCRHHLAIEVTPAGSLKLTFPDRDPCDVEPSCSLDVSEAGGVTLEEAGRYMNVTRERIAQVERAGLLALRHTRTVREIGPGLFDEDRDPMDEQEIAA